MLAFFRNAANSLAGKLVMGFVLLAMVVTLYEARSIGGGGVDDGSVASVGRDQITTLAVRERATAALQDAQAQSPALDLATFVREGGVDGAIEQEIDSHAIDGFASKQGVVVSERAIDGVIASIPAFNGATGRFDRNTFLGVLAQKKLTEAGVRADIRREIARRLVLSPGAAGVRLPATLVEPYAALLLETRKGQVAVAPTTMFGGPPPSPEAVQAYYKANIARYTQPERRVIRYAIVDKATPAAPTDAEIKAYYDAHSADYAATEKRAFTQVIVDNPATAEQIRAAVAGGQPIDVAAKAAGRAAVKIDATTKAAFATLTSDAVANAGFGASRGSVAAVAQSGLGYHVVRVDAVDNANGKSLDQARGAITATLAQQKSVDALRTLGSKIDDAISAGATFDEVLKANNLTAATTPPLTPDGRAPGVPGFTITPQQLAILKDAFQVANGDPAAITQVDGGKAFAFWHVERIDPSAPLSLDKIPALVANDARVEAALKAARTAANAIAAKVNAGTPLAQAVAAAGRALPQPVPAGGRRLEVMRDAQKVPPPLALLFSMTPRSAKVLAMPGNQGFYIVALEAVERAPGALPPQLIEGARVQFSRTAGEEYAAQLAAAIRGSARVERNVGAIAALKAAMLNAVAPATAR
jgi:peptidyl-prolyl cis-trans isomerase D